MSFMAFRSAGAPYKAPQRRVGDQGSLFPMVPPTVKAPVTEREKKEHGMTVAAAKNDEILSSFREIADELGRAGTVTIESVREEAERRGIEYTPGNWMGSVFRGWEWTGEIIPARHKQSHSRFVRVWKRGAK